MTQAELAERAGLQGSAVSHFENGRRMPAFDNLGRLADALGVSTDYLLGRQRRQSAAGPAAQEILAQVENMSEADVAVLAEFARVLARRNTDRES